MINDLILIKNLVTLDDFQTLENIVTELQDTFHKKQIFRTDTEARISVLNDGKFPTPAAKYWQSVREQNVMLENLIALSFEYRRNDLAIKRHNHRLEQAQDDFDREEIQIDLDECTYKKVNMEQIAKDRVREIMMWSKIKHELDDGSFDTQNVNTHQAQSLKLALENRANSLTPGSGPAEVMNVLGPLSTVNRLLNVKENYPQLNSFNSDTELKQIK